MYGLNLVKKPMRISALAATAIDAQQHIPPDGQARLRSPARR